MSVTEDGLAQGDKGLGRGIATEPHREPLQGENAIWAGVQSLLKLKKKQHRVFPFTSASLRPYPELHL